MCNISKRQKNKILNLYFKGLSITAIYHETGCSDSTIRKVLNEFGYTPNKRWKKAKQILYEKAKKMLSSEEYKSLPSIRKKMKYLQEKLGIGKTMAFKVVKKGAKQLLKYNYRGNRKIIEKINN